MRHWRAKSCYFDSSGVRDSDKGGVSIGRGEPSGRSSTKGVMVGSFLPFSVAEKGETHCTIFFGGPPGERLPGRMGYSLVRSSSKGVQGREFSFIFLFRKRVEQDTPKSLDLPFLNGDSGYNISPTKVKRS